LDFDITDEQFHSFENFAAKGEDEAASVDALVALIDSSFDE